MEWYWWVVIAVMVTYLILMFCKGIYICNHDEDEHGRDL